MTPPIFRPRRIAVSVAAVCALGVGQAHGAGFALQENSGSGLGNAFAAGAAGTEDASSMWANPASLSKRMSMEAAAAMHLITPSIKFRDDGSLPAFNQPLGGTGGDAGGLNFVPNMYIAVPINRQWTFGLGVNAPFGLVTEYDGDWIGRYQGVKSSIKTINVNPSVSFKPANNVAIGLGVNFQRIDAEFTGKVSYSGAIATAAQAAAAGGQIPAEAVPSVIAATSGLDSSAKIEGDDTAWGWNVGVLVDVTPATQVGVAYRSEIKYKVTGNANIDNPTPVVPAPLAPIVGALTGAINGTALYSSGITADVKLPAIVNASVFHRVNDRWDVMADVQWTGWSSIKELKFVRTDGAVLSNTPENFDDAWRVSVGANYRHNDRWMFRGGVAFDQSPVNRADRTPRLPDEDRVWVSFGAQYKYSKNLKLDAGFTYIDSKDSSIEQNAGSTAANALIKGNYEAYTTIFSVQGTYTF
ncbi:Long-chain fatty acid transport protein [Burkholderiales bacterium]|nr:Long-chain fatty acid transport protein [Burkholderiales bacterium]